MIDDMPTPPENINNAEDFDSDDDPAVDLDSPTAEHFATLQSAIATVPISRLREICARLVVSDSHVAEALSEELLGLSNHGGEVMSKWAICVHCGEEYSPQSQYDEGGCVLHLGTSVPHLCIVHWSDRSIGVLEVNEQKFGGMEPVDNALNREEYPQNFTWTCCDLDGAADGCVRRLHENSRKRRRVI